MHRENMNTVSVKTGKGEISRSAQMQQDTMGMITLEILRAGKNLNRKNICTKLIARLDCADGPEDEEHLQTLIALLFGRH